MSGVIIEPIVETKIYTINTIVCNIVNINLGISATVMTSYYTTEGQIIKTTTDILSGEDYFKWGADDNYIYQFIANKYGLILQQNNI